MLMLIRIVLMIKYDQIFSLLNSLTFSFFKGLTPLHHCIIGNHTDCIRKLLDSNANINARTHSGSLPIHFAVYLGNTDIFDLLNNQPKAPELIETDQQGNVCINLERKRY